MVADDFKAAAQRAAAAMRVAEDELNTADGRLGDGDTGQTMRRVAEAVHLSPGRFRHLFVSQTGTSFRAWLLWARAEAAIAAATHGVSWTEAAQGAGFADAAHFTRTCRRVFGIAPTMLVFANEHDGNGQR